MASRAANGCLAVACLWISVEGPGVVGCGGSSSRMGPAKPAAMTAWTTPQAPNLMGQTQPATGLPSLPPLTNIAGSVVGDGATVTFDPVDGAADYRIYPLPADGDITKNPDGTITVKNAIYRCAGAREQLYVLADTDKTPYPNTDGSAYGGQTVVTGTVAGVMRSEGDATLGYVYPTPGAGRAPVYVIGNSDSTAGDNMTCNSPIFNPSRQKTYTTDIAKATALLAAGARDDGIGFYVPSDAASNTRPVFEGIIDSDSGKMTLRWVDGPEAAARGGVGSAIFNVLSAPGDGAVPLMRVNLLPDCDGAHDELVAGMARMKQTRYEGDQPATALRWAGMAGSTTLVLEALDQQCPNQGFFAPLHVDAAAMDGQTYPAYMTLSDLQSSSPTGEVFINGQHDPPSTPKAIARSFIQLSPAAPPKLDFFAGFDPAAPEVFMTVYPRDDNGVQRYQSPSWDLWTDGIYQLSYGPALGEMWFAYADIGADVGGKFRLTATKKGTVSDSTFLHVTGEVDMVVTDRRYPQFLISNQEAPVQDNIANAGAQTLIVQPKGWGLASSHQIQVQKCDARPWEVNDQCPILASLPAKTLPAGLVSTELNGVDRTVKYDIYVSTSRIFVLLNDTPYSCTSLPATGEDGKTYGVPSGPVTISWGDILYHSGADIDGPSAGGLAGTQSFQFHLNHMRIVTRRHFDNLGFASGVQAPIWNEARFPCVSAP